MNFNSLNHDPRKTHLNGLHILAFWHDWKMRLKVSLAWSPSGDITWPWYLLRGSLGGGLMWISTHLSSFPWWNEGLKWEAADTSPHLVLKAQPLSVGLLLKYADLWALPQAVDGKPCQWDQLGPLRRSTPNWPLLTLELEKYCVSFINLDLYVMWATCRWVWRMKPWHSLWFLLPFS